MDSGVWEGLLRNKFRARTEDEEGQAGCKEPTEPQVHEWKELHSPGPRGAEQSRTAHGKWETGKGKGVWIREELTQDTGRKEQPKDVGDAGRRRPL